MTREEVIEFISRQRNIPDDEYDKEASIEIAKQFYDAAGGDLPDDEEELFDRFMFYIEFTTR